MIYVKFTQANEQKHIVILEPANLETLKKGEFIGSPTNEVFIAWTPDIMALTEKLTEVGNDIQPDELAKLIKEFKDLPEVLDRRYHQLIDLKAPRNPENEN